MKERSPSPRPAHEETGDLERLVESVQTGASSLQAELDALRSRLADERKRRSEDVRIVETLEAAETEARAAQAATEAHVQTLVQEIESRMRELRFALERMRAAQHSHYERLRRLVAATTPLPPPPPEDRRAAPETIHLPN